MRMTATKQKTQTGIALITAMLVVSLATITAVSMTSEQQIYFRRTENMLFHQQAYLYLLGAEDWARHVLNRDLSNNNTDSSEDDWAQVLPALPVEGGSIAGTIEDLQGRFNLNNLSTGGTNSPDFIRFQQLLQNYQINEDLAFAVLDWIDADSNVTFPNGAEDIEYMSRQPSYRAANGMMQSASELLHVNGFTYDMYQQIAPAIIALPETTEINVNTAPAIVLQMIVPDISESDVKELITDREDTPFENIQDFLTHPLVQGKQVNTAGLTVNSEYFLLKAYARIGRANATLESILHRKGQDAIATIVRSQGGL